jgi:hypothetical protein
MRGRAAKREDNAPQLRLGAQKPVGAATSVGTSPSEAAAVAKSGTSRAELTEPARGPGGREHAAVADMAARRRGRVRGWESLVAAAPSAAGSTLVGRVAATLGFELRCHHLATMRALPRSRSLELPR